MRNPDATTTTNTAVFLSGGDVEYDYKQATVAIDDLIQALEEMKEQGAEYVAMRSGNYRGAQWQRIGTELEMMSYPQDEDDY